MKYRVELIRLDARGQIQVPKHFRHSSGPFRGPHVIPRLSGAELMLIPEHTWAALTESAIAATKTVIELRRVRRAYRPRATVVIDRYGRLTLPHSIRRAAALKGDVVLSQTASSLEIRPHTAFECELESTRALNANVEKLLRQPAARGAPAEPAPGHPLLKTPPSKLAQFTAEQLQRFTRECFWRMGYQCSEIGSTFSADGGIDLIAYSPPSHAFPWMLAVQVATNKDKVGPPKLREFVGALQSLPINVGVLVTNSTFSAQARWYAQQFNQTHSQKLWLRDLQDLKRWVQGDFQTRHYADELAFTLSLYKGGTFVIKNALLTRDWRVSSEPTPASLTDSPDAQRRREWRSPPRRVDKRRA